ncbi:NAD-dependent epimerase [Pararhodonellum marinum]|uniref:NAD-dependent epimerase n=1 Tax=Pararhodonellum marinum TaxID=2755358 RepID=UPI00188EDF4A|nr:NAD-dependent epimerase [Pararhodonellum marinum]
MKFLITGAAGFIGYHLSEKLLDRGDQVIGLDNINDYYDPSLKEERLRNLGVSSADLPWHQLTPSSKNKGFSFFRSNLEDKAELDALFAREKFDVVVNLAAQAGVRYSLENPKAYIDANIVGFLNILEACRNHPVKHLVYASSSSVYGSNTLMPFSTGHNVDHPVSLYAATKKSNELMAHTYSHLFQIPTTGLRFFTVYGPWGRPDMALFLFTKAITEGKPIKVFNFGEMRRDFTYIDDIVEGIIRVADRPAKGSTSWDSSSPSPDTSYAPYKVYNIGNSSPVRLMDFIHAIEAALGKKATLDLLPLQPGDVPASHANVDDLVRDTGYKPDTPIEKGVQAFIDWYVKYYNPQEKKA